MASKTPGVVTSQQLLDLFGGPAKSLGPTAKGYVPPSLRLAKGATPAQQAKLASLLAMPKPMNAVPPVGAGAGSGYIRGTKDYYGHPTNADAKALSYINSTNAINAQSARLDGKAAKKSSNSWWQRALDVLSRGQYASAEATKRLDSAFNESRHEGHGVLSSFGTSLDDFASGLLPGLEGKKKTDFIDVYQRNADEQKARKEQTDKSKKLVVTDGSAKLNPWLKYGAGLVSDIALDPTSYLGVGLVPKLAKAGKYAKDIKEAADAAHGYGLIGKETANNLKNIKDAKLADHAHKLLQDELAHHGALNDVVPHVTPSDKSFQELHGGGKPSLAWTYHKNSGINFAPGWGNREAVQKFLDNPVSNPKGWWAVHSKTPEELMHQTLLHEIGHSIHFKLSDAQNGKMMNEIAQHIEGLTGKKFSAKAIHGGKEMSPEFWNHVSEHLSNYGATSVPEMIAEAWSQHRLLGDKAGGIAKIVGKHLEDYLSNVKRSGISGHEVSNALGLGAQGIKYGKKGQILADGRNLLTTAQREATVRKGLVDINRISNEHGMKAAKDFEAQFLAKHDPGHFYDGAGDLHHNLTPELKSEMMQGIRAAHTTARKATAEHLTELMHKSLNPEVRKALNLKFAGADIGSIATPEFLAKAGSKVANSSVGETFNKAFMAASRRLDPALHQLNVGLKSKAASIMDAHAHNINSVFNVPLKTRQNVWEATAGGLHHVVIPGGKNLANGVATPVGSLVDHFDKELRKIGDAITQEGLTPQEIRKGLPAGGKGGQDPFRLRPQDYIDRKTGEIDPNWLNNEVLNRWGDAVGHDPAKALYLLRAAYTKAVAHKTLHNEIVKGFGISKDTSSPAYKALRSKGYREVRRFGIDNENLLPYHQDMLYHPDIAKHIEALHDMTLDSKTTGAFLKHFDQAQTAFKSSVTKYSPGFYTRNMLGEVMNSFLAGVHNPDVYRKAMQVMTKHDKQYFGPSVGFAGKSTREAKTIGNALMSDPVKAAMDISEPNHTILSNLVGKSNRPRFTDVAGNRISADLIHHAFKEAGLDSGFIRSEFRAGADSGKFGKAGKIVRNMDSKATDLSAAIENYTRMAHFIDALSKTPKSVTSFREASRIAATEVRKFHFDYNDFTKFEKSVLARGIPFYKWTRKNLPLMIEMAFAQPGKAIAPYKALNALSQSQGFSPREGSAIPNAEDIIPQYIRDAGAVPVGHHGKNVVYENGAFPFGQAFQMFGEGPTDTAQNVGQMVTPFAKVPFELLTGNKVGGAPISDTNKYLTQQNPLTNLFLKLSGNPNDPGNTGAPGTGKGSLVTNPALLQFLTGIGMIENTPKMIRSEAKQMQTAAAARRKADLKKKGLKLR